MTVLEHIPSNNKKKNTFTKKPKLTKIELTTLQA